MDLQYIQYQYMDLQYILYQYMDLQYILDMELWVAQNNQNLNITNSPAWLWLMRTKIIRKCKQSKLCFIDTICAGPPTVSGGHVLESK